MKKLPPPMQLAKILLIVSLVTGSLASDVEIAFSPDLAAGVFIGFFLLFFMVFGFMMLDGIQTSDKIAEVSGDTH